MPQTDSFAGAITALWARLDMGAPRFAQPGRVRLRVEGTGLDLADNGRGAMEIEGQAGKLGPAGAVRTEQAGRILRSNLGLLVTNDAGVFLRSGLDGEPVLAVRASYRYAGGSTDRLVAKIEDVVRVIEYYAVELKSANVGAARQARPQPAASAFEPAMIFRP